MTNTIDKNTNELELYDKEKCRRCEYGAKIDRTDNFIFCYYAIRTGKTAIIREGDRIKDARGSDKKNCLLFKAKGAN